MLYISFYLKLKPKNSQMFMTLLEKGEHFHFPISVYPRLPCNQSKFLVKSGILDTLDRERELSENKGMI